MPFTTRAFCSSILISCMLAVSLLAHADTATPNYTLTRTLNMPGSTRWDYLTFDAPHHLLYITRGNSVDVLNTDSNSIVGTLPNLEGVHGVALAPEFNKGFVTEGKANRVTVFDLTSLKVLATVPTGNKPDAIIYDAATQLVFATDGENGDLTAIDVKTNSVKGKVRLDGQPEFAAVDNKGRLYVNLEDKSQIAVIDTKKLKTIAHYNLAPACDGPTGLTLDKADNRLFSTCRNKTMLVVDAATGKIIDTLPIGQHSDAATYDVETGLAFSSNGDGTLTVVGKSNDQHYKVIQNVETKVTARTMALDPATHTLYLAAAETEGVDPATEKQPKPRPHIKPDTFMILTVSAGK